MNRRRKWSATMNRHASTLSGYGAREALIQLTGHAPVYVASEHAYSCQQHTLEDACALAQRLGIDVEIVGRRARRARLLDALMAAPAPRFPEQADPGSGLW
ncbi:MAG: hypothetical protein WA966_01340 [Ornithinimicrobium sp.]